MEKSNHKNYIDQYDRNRQKLAKTIILPNEKSIFELFNKKFSIDADADTNRGRLQLGKLGHACADSCSKIHQILSGEPQVDARYKDLVNSIVNLDYDSLKEVFQEIQNEYFNSGARVEVSNYLQDVCKYLDKMRQISKNYTNVISKG